MNTTIISNPVFQSIQYGEGYESHTGTILYANKYAGVSQVDMPDDIKKILDSDIGSVGTNPIVQLKNKLAALPNGPWYIDCRNGILYIHNRKFNEDTVHDYVYQSENGEVLSLTFETQRRTKSLGHSTGGGIDPFSKDIVGINSNVKSPTPGPGEKNRKPMKSHINVVAAIDATRVINSNANTTRTQMEFRERSKSYPKKKAAQRNETESRYQAYKNGNTINRQFTKSVNSSSNARKNKWARNIYSKLDAVDRVDLSNKAVAAWKKSHNRNSVLKLVREYFGYGKHMIISPIWKEQWVDPTTYTGNNTFQGRGSSFLDNGKSYYDQKNLNEHLSYMKNDPKIKILSNVTVSNPDPTGRPYKHYRIKVFRLTYTRGLVDSSQIVTDWLIRLMNQAYNSNNSSGNSISVSNGGGISSYAPGLVGNTGRTVTEKKLVVTMRVIGRPSLESSQIIHISNVGKKWSGDYYIKTCSHDMSPDMGYTCTLELNKNGEKAEVESTTTKLSTTKVVSDLSSSSDNKYNKSRMSNNTPSSNKDDKSYKREYYSTSKVTTSLSKKEYRTKNARDK